MWKLHEIQISASIYKVLLEHSLAPSFICCGFYALLAELDSWIVVQQYWIVE